MSKQPSTKNVKSALTQVLDDIIFSPSIPQRKLKAAFWTRYGQNPMATVSTMTGDLASRISGSSSVKSWWEQPGFKEWFLNEDEFRQKLEYLASLALDTIEEVLLDPEANANAKSSMSKLVLEAASKMPSKWQNTKYMDEQVQKMDEAQLEAFIKQRGIGLLDDGQKDKSNGDSGDD